MPRAEFARYDSKSSAAPAVAAEPLPTSPNTDAPSEPIDSDPRLDPGLRVLLLEEDAESAQQTTALLHDLFGERCIRDWVSDPNEAIELMQKNLHDIYLFSDGPTAGNPGELIRSSIQSGCKGPIIVIAKSPNTDSDLKAVDAGAADYIPKRELTPAMIERSIRHALVRQHRIVQARQEIEELTAEKARLNVLRDANHRFVENACHDFRSPLTVIKEFAAIIAEGLAGDVNDEQSEFLQIILTRVDHLSHMVDGILDASRLESDVIGVKREEHSVAALVEQARPTLEQRAEAHKVKIEFAVPASLPNVFADAESVSRIIVNLGTNACKYAGENGKIRIWARYDADMKTVTVGVTDGGPGIAPEHVKLIFDRFQQIPSEKGQEKDGFGLGLHIASELVRVNFGTLSVESEPQKGSTFAFTLPIFDVNSLIPLHFAFLKTSRHSFQKVSIAVANANGNESSAFGEVERFLNRQLRSYDLLLRLREGSWLVCSACDESELTKITDRILGTYVEGNRNRPDGPLPDLRFRIIGTWALANRPDGLTDAIRGAYALSPEGREIH